MHPGLPSTPLAGVMATSRSNTSLQPAPRLVVERRWRLGLCSRAHPSSIMQASWLRVLAVAGFARLLSACEGTPVLDHAGTLAAAAAAGCCCRRERQSSRLAAHCGCMLFLLSCSRACPPSTQSVQELYRTLQYCGVHWKKNGPYNLKCRAVLHLSPSAAGEAGGVAAANGQAGLGRDPSDDSMGVAMEASPAAGAQQQQGGLAAALAAEDTRMAEAAAAVVSSGSGAGEGPWRWQGGDCALWHLHVLAGTRHHQSGARQQGEGPQYCFSCSSSLLAAPQK